MQFPTLFKIGNKIVAKLNLTADDNVARNFFHKLIKRFAYIVALSVKNAKRIEIKQVDTGQKKIECLTPLNVDKLLYIYICI